MVIGGSNSAPPQTPPALSSEGAQQSEAAQAAAVKIFKQATEAEPKAAMDLLEKTLAPGVGGRLNVVA